MPKFLLLFFVFSLQYNCFFAQNYPKDFFIAPLDIPLKLSGNFGELRDNHFHSGMDFKTQQKEGFNVLAVADGYVSRIKISHYGYGKAIYITHPNGYTTLYGHLKKMNTKLEEYIKKFQYADESYEIEIFPKPNELPVKKGEVFAFSGNTGSSGGPHLHYEIRESDTQKPINPILFGLDIEDTTKPKLNYLYVFPLDSNTYVNKVPFPHKINLKQDKYGNFSSDTIFANGKIGFAVNTYDQQDGDSNQNGIYKLQMFINDTISYEHELENFTFSESKLINLHIDYGIYKTKNIRLQKCFVPEYNKLSTYKRGLLKNGFINVSKNDSLQIKISISDINNNTTLINVPVIGVSDTTEVLKTPVKSNYKAKPNESLSVKLKGIEVYFPKNTFYHNADLDINMNTDKSIKIHEDVIPLGKNFTIRFDLSHLDENTKKHSYIAKIDNKEKLYYISSKYKENSLEGNAKTLGYYTVKQDFKEPAISPVNFKENQWISSEKFLLLKISDDLSGIKSYRAKINGKWILTEFEYKTGILTYDFNDLDFGTSQHELEVWVTDHVGNTKKFTTTFYRKNIMESKNE